MNARQFSKHLPFKDPTFHGEFGMRERLAGPDAQAFLRVANSNLSLGQ